MTASGIQYTLRLKDAVGYELGAPPSDTFLIGNSAVILMFDLTCRHAFERELGSFPIQIDRNGVNKVFLLGNKLDGKREVSKTEAEFFCQHSLTNAEYFEISSLDRNQVDAYLARVCENLLCEDDLTSSNITAQATPKGIKGLEPEKKAGKKLF